MPGWRRPGAPPLPVRELGRYLYNEPAGSVIRAGAIPELGAQLGAGLLDPQVAYLTGDGLHSTPLATVFEVRQQLSVKLRALRKWVREAEIGVLRKSRNAESTSTRL